METLPNANEDAAPQIDQTRVRYLTPEMCRIHIGSHGALHVTVTGERIYGGVYAAHAFPVAHAEEFISMIHTGGDARDREIGIIRHLTTFPPEEAQLVREALARRYFVHRITRIHKVGWRYGMVRMDVETDKGRIEFLMPWKSDRAVDYGPRGKVLIDVENNRYLIPDLQELPPKERQDFQRVIYW